MTTHPRDRAAPPEIDEYGLLRYGGAWVALSPKEEPVVRALLVGWPRVVSRQQLLATGWPGRAPGTTTALDKVIGRLRRRLTPLGLAIDTVRSRGLILRPTDLTRDQPEGQPCPTSSPPSSSPTSSRR